MIEGLWRLFAELAGLIFTALDEILSAGLISAAPWVMWMLWGMLIGGVMAFWTVAPIYGLRKHRALIIIAPFVLMGLVGMIRLMVR